MDLTEVYCLELKTIDLELFFLNGFQNLPVTAEDGRRFFIGLSVLLFCNDLM